MSSRRDYEELQVIGRGAYGTVFKAYDVEHNRDVALKRVRIVNDSSEKGVPVSTLREITLLKQLDNVSHPNIVRMFDAFQTYSTSPSDSPTDLILTIVFEHVNQDLSLFLKNAPQGGITDIDRKSILCQILQGVDYLHINRLVHRDIKPQNILITANKQVKIADFGLARVYGFCKIVTSTVVTLWWRAPEILLQAPYATPVDIWSVGAVMAELYNRRTLFTGRNEINQIHKVLSVIGCPLEDDWPSDAAVKWTNFKEYKKINFQHLIPAICLEGVKLIERMLVFKGPDRITAREALSHPYFSWEAIYRSTLANSSSQSSASGRRLSQQGTSYQGQSIAQPSLSALHPSQNVTTSSAENSLYSALQSAAASSAAMLAANNPPSPSAEYSTSTAVALDSSTLVTPQCNRSSTGDDAVGTSESPTRRQKQAMLMRQNNVQHEDCQLTPYHHMLQAMSSRLTPTSQRRNFPSSSAAASSSKCVTPTSHHVTTPASASHGFTPTSHFTPTTTSRYHTPSPRCVPPNTSLQQSPNPRCGKRNTPTTPLSTRIMSPLQRLSPMLRRSPTVSPNRRLKTFSESELGQELHTNSAAKSPETKCKLATSPLASENAAISVTSQTQTRQSITQTNVHAGRKCLGEIKQPCRTYPTGSPEQFTVYDEHKELDCVDYGQNDEGHFEERQEELVSIRGHLSASMQSTLPSAIDESSRQSGSIDESSRQSTDAIENPKHDRMPSNATLDSGICMSPPLAYQCPDDEYEDVDEQQQQGQHCSNCDCSVSIIDHDKLHSDSEKQAVSVIQRQANSYAKASRWRDDSLVSDFRPQETFSTQGEDESAMSSRHFEPIFERTDSCSSSGIGSTRASKSPDDFLSSSSIHHDATRMPMQLSSQISRTSSGFSESMSSRTFSSFTDGMSRTSSGYCSVSYLPTTAELSSQASSYLDQYPSEAQLSSDPGFSQEYAKSAASSSQTPSAYSKDYSTVTSQEDGTPTLQPTAEKFSTSCCLQEGCAKVCSSNRCCSYSTYPTLPPTAANPVATDGYHRKNSLDPSSLSSETFVKVVSRRRSQDYDTCPPKTPLVECDTYVEERHKNLKTKTYGFGNLAITPHTVCASVAVGVPKKRCYSPDDCYKDSNISIENHASEQQNLPEHHHYAWHEASNPTTSASASALSTQAVGYSLIYEREEALVDSMEPSKKRQRIEGDA